MSAAYINYTIGMFTQALDNNMKEAKQALQSAYSSDPFTLFHYNQHLDYFYNQTKEKVVNKLNNSVSLQLQPQEFVKSLAEELRKEAYESAMSLMFFDSGFHKNLIKMKVVITQNLVTLLSFISTIETQNIRNFGC
ncbi:hypothetical protein JYQ62_34870 [Nostoc sp. UHCC 0702]|nr:hypothetical protein JYQ62_34870 [Nostoc sp. UHCC 0702]